MPKVRNYYEVWKSTRYKRALTKGDAQVLYLDFQGHPHSVQSIQSYPAKHCNVKHPIFVDQMFCVGGIETSFRGGLHGKIFFIVPIGAKSNLSILNRQDLCDL